VMLERVAFHPLHHYVVLAPCSPMS
jgi:hypothetical protein